MIRARVAFAAAVVSTLVISGTAVAQVPTPADLQPILSGKTFVPPFRGEAVVEFTSTKPNREKDNVVTRFTVKNVTTAPLARLQISETWYDKGGSVLTGGRGEVRGLLQPDEVQTITIVTPWKNGMTSNNYNFSHGNGTVKPKRVAKIDVPKETAKK